MSSDVRPRRPPTAEQVQTFVCLVDELEEREPGYLTLGTLRSALNPEMYAILEWALRVDLLLVDQRHHIDELSGTTQPVSVCRLNRHHPIVRSPGNPPQR
jgi:hypothetical protein